MDKIRALPVLDNPWLDETTDQTLVLLHGLDESGNAYRIPMNVATAMRVLALLQALRRNRGYPLPEIPVNTDTVQ